MKKSILALLSGLFLAGCGVDGPPVPPEPKTTGVTVSGTVEVGVVGGS